MWRNESSPIDRCLEQLDREIVRVQQQARKVTVRATYGPPFKSAAASSQESEQEQPSQTFTGFVEAMLTPTNDKVSPSYNTIPDLYEANAEPLKDLEAQPIGFAQQSEPDLFTLGQKMPLAQTARPGSKARTHSSTSAPKADEKLVQYLGAAGAKSYRPLKHVQRTARNRFYMWIGLSFVALWLIYFVVR